MTRHQLRPLSVILLPVLSLTGCWDNTPPPPRTPVPGQANTTSLRPSDPIRPLAQPPAPPEDPNAGLPFYDEPLVNQRPPEQQHFVEIYNQVGRPRIVLFVNRTLQGDVVSTGDTKPIWSQRSDTRTPTNHTSSSTDVYTQPGTYDELNARSLDYEAVENIMTDWIASNGQVTVTSPTLARQRLSDETIKEMQAGRPQVLAELAQQLNADVLIQIAARPTHQTPQGPEVRLVAEAMNIKGGQSLGRAVVDVPPPLEKTTINQYTRFLARKLMDDMSQTWQAPPPDAFRRPETTTPATPSSSTPATPPPSPAPATTTPPPPPAPATPPPPPQSPVPQQPPAAPAPAAPPAPPAPPAP